MESLSLNSREQIDPRSALVNDVLFSSVIIVKHLSAAHMQGCNGYFTVELITHKERISAMMLNSDPGEMFSFILINLLGSRGKVKLEIQNKGHAVT